uniref:Uncharacterized protein n=1 Tax=Cyanothece sp. (strain PCC 7425 / ATCC 29141) TaxID=395961 RepID=B8HSE1_CYAP4
MILPIAVNQAVGLKTGWQRLGLSPTGGGVEDAETDLAFLEASGLAVIDS